MTGKHIGPGKRLKLELFAKLQDRRIEEHRLRQLFWECTLRCNAACLHCGSDCRVQSELKDMPVEDFCRALDSVARQYVPHKVMVNITGGEPLVRRGCVELCRMIAQVPGIREIDLTTNGILLPRYAHALKDAGVTRVNISIDSLDSEKYARITGGGSLSDALGGIRAAAEAGLTPIKLNTVLIGGFNDGEIPDFVELTRDAPLELRFIELMPMGGRFGPEAYLPGDTVLERVPSLEPLAENGGVARLYRLPGGLGRVGLISPLSRHFCRTCNRLRLTSEGSLKPCLHSGQEIPVRGQHGQELIDTLRRAIFAKPRMHGTLDAAHPSEAGRSMNTIGG